jgi:Arc/MetJ family transcription regulator
MCENHLWEIKMATNLALDPELLDEAHRIGGHRTKKATVTEALKEYIQRRKQLRVMDHFGTIDYDADYDYKEQRKRS